MPRYHFNVFDGSHSSDEIGTELASRETAQLEAVALAGSILRDNPESVRSGSDWHMEVTDERGLILLRLDVAVTCSPG